MKKKCFIIGKLENVNLFEAVRIALNEIIGAYAIVVMEEGVNDEFVGDLSISRHNLNFPNFKYSFPVLRNDISLYKSSICAL